VVDGFPQGGKVRRSAVDGFPQRLFQLRIKNYELRSNKLKFGFGDLKIPIFFIRVNYTELTDSYFMHPNNILLEL
jgi:hypothetical protein